MNLKNYIFPIFIFLLHVGGSSMYAECPAYDIVSVDIVNMTASVCTDRYDLLEDGKNVIYLKDKNTDKIISSTSNQTFTNVPVGNFYYIENKRYCYVSVYFEINVDAINDDYTLPVVCDPDIKNKEFILDVTSNDYISGSNSIPDDASFEIISKDESSRSIVFCEGKKIHIIPDVDEDVVSEEIRYSVILSNKSADTAVVTLNYQRSYPKIDVVSPKDDKVDVQVSGGTAPYIYEVNGIAYNDADNIDCPSTGTNQLNVIDANGCKVDAIFYVPQEIVPDSYFTPNGDGVHDEWNIKNIETITDYQIKIYDRSGKLLKEYEDDFTPWNGVYNGTNLRSEDYWYIIYLHNSDQTYSGHFTLIR